MGEIWLPPNFPEGRQWRASPRAQREGRGSAGRPRGERAYTPAYNIGGLGIWLIRQ